jgi:hypothetical protein
MGDRAGLALIALAVSGARAGRGLAGRAAEAVTMGCIEGDRWAGLGAGAVRWVDVGLA